MELQKIKPNEIGRLVGRPDVTYFTQEGKDVTYYRWNGQAMEQTATIPKGAAAELVGGAGGKSSQYRFSRRGLRVAAATASIWFPLNDRGNAVQSDMGGTIQGSIKGGAGLRWGASPGMTFNGSNHRVECNYSLGNAPKFSSLVMPPRNGSTGTMRRCADLASLVADGDMILMWAVISHAATPVAADMVIASFGMNADPAGKGGWAIGIKAGTPGKVQFMHRARGSSAVDTQILPMDGITGKNNDNTRTAIAVEINASPIAGLLEVRTYMLTLGTDGGNSQNNVGALTPALVPFTGTGACGPDVTCPLTIGAWPDSIPYANNAPAGTIATGSANHLTLAADFGAPGAQGSTVAFTQGIWLWFGPVATVPALTAKLYWCVFSTLRIATIYSNGPGSAPINFTTGLAYSVVSPNFVQFFVGSIGQLGIERRPRDYGLGMRVCRDLREDQRSHPISLAA